MVLRAEKSGWSVEMPGYAWRALRGEQINPWRGEDPPEKRRAASASAKTEAAHL